MGKGLRPPARVQVLLPMPVPVQAPIPVLVRVLLRVLGPVLVPVLVRALLQITVHGLPAPLPPHGYSRIPGPVTVAGPEGQGHRRSPPGPKPEE